MKVGSTRLVHCFLCLLIFAGGTARSDAFRPLLARRSAPHSARRPRPPAGRGDRIAPLFAEDDKLDGDGINYAGQSGGRPDPTPSRRDGGGRRRHVESNVTAAGAESLFSTSVWSSSFARKRTSTTFRRTEYEAGYAELVQPEGDLPQIDCGWACRSDGEEVQLRLMKRLLEPELRAVAEDGLRTTYPDVYGDLRLLRFLRKSKVRDVVSSAERYRSFLAWRAENDVDGIRALVAKSDDSATPFQPLDGRLQAVAEYFPMKFDYVLGSRPESFVGDNAVRPAILYVGCFGTQGISEKIASSRSSVTLDDFLDYWVFLYESIHLHLYRQSILSGEMAFLDEVCDLDGLTVRQFGPYFVTKVMKPWLRMTQDNYPETTRRIYVLNPPPVVDLAWRLVTPLLSQGTVDKIRFERQFDGTADEFCAGSGCDDDR